MAPVWDRRQQRLQRPRPAVVIRCHEPEPRCLRELLAGLEEEGVPALVSHGDGTAETLAAEAAQESTLDVGVGMAGGTVCVQHAKLAHHCPALVADSAQARIAGHNAARFVVGLPVKPAPERPAGPPRPATSVSRSEGE